MPFFELIAYEVTGDPVSRRGAPRFCEAAQRLSEVHVVTGAGFETTTGTTTAGLFVGTGNTTGLTGLGGSGAGSAMTAGLVQFSGDEITGPVSVMTSGVGADGCVAQPARNSSALEKMIPANFDTRQLCGTGKRTQAVSSSVLLAIILVLVLELILFEAEEEEEAELPGSSRGLFAARNCGMIFRK